jgi:hypothetical protein
MNDPAFIARAASVVVGADVRSPCLPMAGCSLGRRHGGCRARRVAMPGSSQLPLEMLLKEGVERKFL